jgi:hypothetical protein
MGTVRFRVVETDGQEIVQEIHKVVVHRFNISDTDDPEIYAAEPIYRWEKSEAGQFVMKHAIDVPVFHKQLNSFSYGYEYAITAELEMKKLSEFYLRWGDDGSNKIR